MKYAAKKIVWMLLTMVIVSFLAFLAFRIIPGDPTAKLLGEQATPERVEALRQELGLDRPFLERYVSWLGDFVRGDMGSSYNYSMPVSQMLQGKIPVTGLLTLLSFLLIVVLSIPLGLFTARHSETGEEMVVYQALYGEKGCWVRPAAMWQEVVKRENYTGPRFTWVEP